MQRKALDHNGIVISILFGVFGIVAAQSLFMHQIEPNGFVPFFSILLFAYGIIRLTVQNKKILLAIAFCILFFSLLIGYIDSSFCMIEFFFIPLVLFDISIHSSYAWPKPVPVLITVSILSAFLFPGSKTSFQVFFKDKTISIPVVSFTMFFFLACSCLFVHVSFLRYKNERMKEELGKKENHNSNLMKINSEISSKLFQIQQDSSEEERLRITKEVHDTAGYVFINVIMMLQAALAIIDKDYTKGKEKVESALEYTRRGMNEIRMVLHEMRAYEKPDIGIQNELYNIVAVFRKATNINVRFEYGNWPKHFERKETELFLESLVQECLTNTVKHGNADSIDIICWKDEESYSISIHDNGKAKQKNLLLGIGLSGIEDFVNSRGGCVSYGYDQEGFIVRVKLPLSC